jgi:hypothetical protein
LGGGFNLKDKQSIFFRDNKFCEQQQMLSNLRFLGNEASP